MTLERLFINSSPEARKKAVPLLVVAKKVFAGFVTEDHGNISLSPESLTIVRVGGVKPPLYVVAKDEISIGPNSHPRRVDIGKSLVVEFGDGQFFSSLGWLSESCLSVTCGGEKGDMAVIRNGNLNLDYLTGKHRIRACVVFVGMSGKMSMGDIKSWGGFVVID